MRHDEVGLFWQDEPQQKRGEPRKRLMPPIPVTGWTPPRYLPDLSSAKEISIDCETYEAEFDTNGPGWARGKGHIVGVSVGADGGGRWYFPLRHEIEPEYNLDPGLVFRWLNHTLGSSHQLKVGANLLYDVGWLKQEGVNVHGPLFDVQYAEALLDERAKVNLNALGLKYLQEGKETNILYQWCADYYGGKPDQKQRANIYRAPPRLVGPYAESDADLPLRLAPILYQKMQYANLLDVFHMECGLIPLLTAMRFRGVRVDVGRAEQLHAELIKREAALQVQLNNLVGFHVQTTESASIARAFDSLKLKYNLTATGQASFTKQFMQNTKNPVADLINEIRKLAKLRGTFIESYILESHINGNVHGQFHLLRADEGGTRSGRLSSSTPNLQNIPARDEELAPLVRGLFIPDKGHKQWRKYDYSQIEYRYLVHFAVGKGSDEARQLFNTSPDTDYHDMTMDMVAPVAGWDVATPEKRKVRRRPLKNINFGLVFGMGEPKLARDLNLTLKEGKELFKHYHAAVPFARETMKACTEEINRLGYITTILGRRSYFDLWEPSGYGLDRDESPALPYQIALNQYGGNIQRAYSHKGLNRRLQGSAADQLKRAMLDAWNSGVFDYIGVPSLTVHDELDFSDPGNVDDGFDYLRHTLETAIPLRIPVRADCEIGPDWGHVK